MFITTNRSLSTLLISIVHLEMKIQLLAAVLVIATWSIRSTEGAGGFLSDDSRVQCLNDYCTKGDEPRFNCKVSILQFLGDINDR